MRYFYRVKRMGVACLSALLLSACTSGLPADPVFNEVYTNPPAFKYYRPLGASVSRAGTLSLNGMPTN